MFIDYHYLLSANIPHPADYSRDYIDRYHCQDIIDHDHIQIVEIEATFGNEIVQNINGNKDDDEVLSKTIINY